MSPHNRPTASRAPSRSTRAAPLPVTAPTSSHDVAVLVYHRFAAEPGGDPMTVSVATLDAQLRQLRDSGYQIVPLRDLVAWRHDADVPLPHKAVALTVDEGHRSILEWLRPLACRERLPITLFVQPSALDTAADTLTWAQLRELHATGQFDVQIHTWWQPGFGLAAPPRADTLAQLRQARAALAERLDTAVDMLAWPFGTHDPALAALANEAGYRAGFTFDACKLRRDTPEMTLPRYLMVEACSPAVLQRLLHRTDEAGRA
jgi:peptidoglycan/xylan/chitin deacetylase (PgdA/CDA1 family)